MSNHRHDLEGHVNGHAGSAQPALVSVVAARQLSTGERAAGASPVFVGLGLAAAVLIAVTIIGLRPRWRAVAVVVAGLALVVLAEIAVVALDAPDASLFLPVPLFVVATTALRAHSASGDAAAVCLATAVLTVAVAVLSGQKENPPILVATVFSFVFLVLTACLVVAANVACILAAAAPRLLHR